MSNDIKSAEECLKAVRILTDELNTAKRSFINSESCVVNRGLMQAQLDYLRQNLPDTVQKAAEIVKEEESIVRRARVECDELRESARQEAAELHKNTLDYMDSLLADTDRKLSELINNIRLERNEIRNHR